jgi:hypothetical protein
VRPLVIRLHDGAAATLTCRVCGYCFETLARSNRTRCGRCRSSVRVSLNVRDANGCDAKQAPDALLLLLSCGHVSIFFDEGVRTSKVDRWYWTCDECRAQEQEPSRSWPRLPLTRWSRWRRSSYSRSSIVQLSRRRLRKRPFAPPFTVLFGAAALSTPARVDRGLRALVLG